MTGLTIIAWMIIFNFFARTAAGLWRDRPPLQGLAYVA
jgi:hypothetical protein